MTNELTCIRFYQKGNNELFHEIRSTAMPQIGDKIGIKIKDIYYTGVVEERMLIYDYDGVHVDIGLSTLFKHIY